MSKGTEQELKPGQEETCGDCCHQAREGMSTGACEITPTLIRRNDGSPRCFSYRPGPTSRKTRDWYNGGRNP